LFLIFPITQVNSRDIDFCGIKVPWQSMIRDLSNQTLDAVYGYFSRFLVLLSVYLDIPLPNSISFQGSKTIISNSIGDIFKLYMDHNTVENFEAAQKLFNYNAYYICYSQGMRFGSKNAKKYPLLNIFYMKHYCKTIGIPSNSIILIYPYFPPQTAHYFTDIDEVEMKNIIEDHNISDSLKTKYDKSIQTEKEDNTNDDFVVIGNDDF